MAIESRNLSDEQLTRAVVQSFENAPSERTREILQSLVPTCTPSPPRCS